MKILYITTIGSTMNFFRSLVKVLIDKGNIVDIATNESISPVAECYREWGCKVYPLSCTRSPLNKGTLRAICEVREILKKEIFGCVELR